MLRAVVESQAGFTTQPLSQEPKGVPYETKEMARIELLSGQMSCMP